MYDPENYPKVFGDRWSELCDWGEKNGFKSAFILQPFVDFGKNRNGFLPLMIINLIIDIQKSIKGEYKNIFELSEWIEI